MRSLVIRLFLLLGLFYPALASAATVVEFYNTNLDNYFITADANEAAQIDNGSAGPGWVRTGNIFQSGGSTSVCRFYGSQLPGPNSHFYTVDPAECQGMKDQQIPAGDPRKLTVKSWNFESLDFVSTPATNGACPTDTMPVYRAYNNGFARGIDSNHRITSSTTAIQEVVARGWNNEGVIMCAPNGGSSTSKLLIQAWNPDGTVASINDFGNYINYTTGTWHMWSNFGIFPIGKSPATPQIGSIYSSVWVGSVNYIAMDVPTNQPFYFTALWKAPVIGTVFMRADNGGAGFLINSNQPQKLELPYDFALAEYQQAQKLLPGNSLSPEAQSLLSQATAAMDVAKNASSSSARAVAAYSALSFVMPLKERLVLDASNKSISTTGLRSDFDLNYEGFGGWTVAKGLPGFISAKEAGFKSVFTYVDWERTSPTQGVYDFSWLDYQIDQADKLGFTVALIINSRSVGLAPWMKNLSFNDLKTLFYENARIVVARYGSRVSWYYASSELELATGGLTLEQVGELAKQSLNGARAAAPNMPFGIYESASVYVPYWMNPGSNFTSFSGLDLIGYLSKNNINYDFLGLEMQYGTTFAPIDLQRFQEVLQDVYNVAKIPIYMGETGYSSKSEDYGTQAPFFWHDGLTQQAQYEWADGTLRILYAMPFVKGYYWVHLDPDNVDQGSDYFSSLVGTGFVRADGSVKKVYSAFKDFNSQMASFVAGSSGSPVSLAVTGGDNQSAPVNSAFSSTLQVIVRDFLGNHVPNVKVTFTAPSSGASGLFQGASLSATANTDSTGLASAPSFSSNGSAGNYTVKASVVGVSTPTIFTLTNTN